MRFFSRVKKREGEHIKKTDCVNKRVEGRTKKEYKIDNKERLRENEKVRWPKYYEEHKEEILAQKREYRQQNRDTINEKAKAYREANKEKVNEQMKKYREKNRDEINARRRERRKQQKSDTSVA